jgi:two-component system response regulator (stage 0 sporulation protein A)
MDVLLKLGMPAGLKGITYICDAIELFDKDPYYNDGKICSLYGEIAKKHNTTASGVERAIRHAFEKALDNGDEEDINYYLDETNTTNSNLLHTLYFRMQQTMKKEPEEQNCLETCAMKEQIYQEIMDLLCRGLASELVKRLGIQ